MSQLIETPSLQVRSRAPRRTWLWVTSFLIAFVIALSLDIPLSTWAHHATAPTISSLPRWQEQLIRFYGIFWYITIPASLLLMIRDRLHRRPNQSAFARDAALVFLAGVFSGVNQFLKWTFGRVRPFHDVPPFHFQPFIGGLHGLIHAEQALSFPSGDVSLAFAMTGSLSIVAPKLTPLWWILGIWMVFERIAQGAHYPSDTVAAAALGLLCAAAAKRVIDLLEKP